ncbi:MAG: hypothetical protein AAGI17_03850 [Planctomycetota bacterium]
MRFLGYGCALALIALAGCGESPAPAETETSTSTTPAPLESADAPAEPEARLYTVRGQIAQLPDPSNPTVQLSIKHEHIPDFVNSTGEVPVRNGVPGMMAMTMPFPRVDESIDLTTFEVGDLIEFDLNVAWRGTVPNFWISRMDTLPEGTELDYEPKETISVPTP